MDPVVRTLRPPGTQRKMTTPFETAISISSSPDYCTGFLLTACAGGIHFNLQGLLRGAYIYLRSKEIKRQVKYPWGYF